MKVGFCTTDYHEKLSIEELAKDIKSYGYEAVQLTLETIGLEEIPESISKQTIKDIKKYFDYYGLEFSAMNGTFNMAHPDKKERDKMIGRYEGLVEAAAEMGCPILTLCTGSRNRDSMWRPHPDNNTQEAWEDMVDTTRKVVSIAEKYPVVLAVETEASNIVNSAKKARKLLDEIKSDSLKMIIDCANLFSPGMAYKANVRPVMKEAFDLFGDEIVLAHGKDILETEGVEFCPTGQGIIDYDYFAELLKKIDYKGVMIMHGIYDFSLIPGCNKLIREKLAKAGL